MNLFGVIPKVYAECPINGPCIIDGIGTSTASAILSSLSNYMYLQYTFMILVVFFMGFSFTVWVFKK